jgi:peptidoglycan hydrolase CwlO-like protein
MVLVFLDFTVSIHERRLEQSTVAKEATLLTEHKEKDAISKALAEAQERIKGLLKENYSASTKIDQLQNTVERFVFFFFWLPENHVTYIPVFAWEFLRAK